MTTLFANNADTQLATAINAVQTTITVDSASEFPPGVSPTDPLWVTFQSEDLVTIEIVKCIGVAGNTLTVIRGQDGTAGQTFLAGALVEARLVREVFTEIQNDIASKAPIVHTHVLADVTDAGTAAGINVPAAGDAAINEAVLGSDTRLIDARTPTPHTHVLADVTDAGTAAAVNVPAAGNAATNEAVLGSDTRLTDARTPTPHTHVEADITDLDKYTQAQVDAALASKEDDLGNPTVDGYILSSTVAGVRSWIENTGGGGGIGEAPADGLGYVRDGLAAAWHRGAKVFVAATEPPEMNIGDFWVET